jgi:hypothetical protein
MGEFIFLNRTRYYVSLTLTILECTLWSAINPNDLGILSWSLNDFERIDPFNAAACDSAHKADLDWLTSTRISVYALLEEQRYSHIMLLPLKELPTQNTLTGQQTVHSQLS